MDLSLARRAIIAGELECAQCTLSALELRSRPGGSMEKTELKRHGIVYRCAVGELELRMFFPWMRQRQFWQNY